MTQTVPVTQIFPEHNVEQKEHGVRIGSIDSALYCIILHCTAIYCIALHCIERKSVGYKLVPLTVRSPIGHKVLTQGATKRGKAIMSLQVEYFSFHLR